MFTSPFQSDAPAGCGKRSPQDVNGRLKGEGHEPARAQAHSKSGGQPVLTPSNTTPRAELTHRPATRYAKRYTYALARARGLARRLPADVASRAAKIRRNEEELESARKTFGLLVCDQSSVRIHFLQRKRTGASGQQAPASCTIHTMPASVAGRPTCCCAVIRAQGPEWHHATMS